MTPVIFSHLLTFKSRIGENREFIHSQRHLNAVRINAISFVNHKNVDSPFVFFLAIQQSLTAILAALGQDEFTFYFC